MAKSYCLSKVLSLLVVPPALWGAALMRDGRKLGIVTKLRIILGLLKLYRSCICAHKPEPGNGAPNGNPSQHDGCGGIKWLCHER